MMRKRSAGDPIGGDVYQQLRHRILSLEVKPGARLVEDEICDLLQAGRTPVREALLRLQGEGLVGRERGWIVQATDPTAFRTIFESRMAIEGYATRLAAERAPAAALDDLEGLIVEMDKADVLPRSEVNRLNQDFHKRIVALSQNPFFVEMHERTQFQYWNLRYPVIFMKDQLTRSADHHREILRALRARDPEAAEKVTREHIAMTMNIVAEALED